MENVDQSHVGTDELVVTNQDVLFDCPSCGKSMVIEQAAIGLVIECAGCQQQVIVPARLPAPDKEELLTAAQTGDADLVRELIARAADVQARDNSGWTPLMRAAHAGNLDAAKVLLENGADFQAVSHDGTSALRLAEQAGHYSIVRLLWKAGAKA
ncbi:MAG: ankyrin repeat domain-containing protein [Verrucomicrobiota bacterium]